MSVSSSCGLASQSAPGITLTPTYYPLINQIVPRIDSIRSCRERLSGSSVHRIGETFDGHLSQYKIESQRLQVLQHFSRFFFVMNCFMSLQNITKSECSWAFITQIRILRYELFCASSSRKMYFCIFDKRFCLCFSQAKLCWLNMTVYSLWRNKSS